jgi:hypothetical protein
VDISLGFALIWLLFGVLPWLVVIWILFRVVGAWRRRGEQLDRIERRLDDLDRRMGPR